MTRQRDVILLWLASVLAAWPFGNVVVGAERGWQVVQEDREFILGQGFEEIRFQVHTPSEGKAVWKLLLGSNAVPVWIFVVDEDWERKFLNDAAKLTKPKIDAAGQVLSLSADWEGTPDQPALQYTLALRPTDDGVSVELEFETRRNLVFLYGIQCLIGLDPAKFTEPDVLDEYQVFAMPSTHGRLGSYLNGVCKSVLIGKRGERAYAVAGCGQRLMQVTSSRSGEYCQVIATVMPAPDTLWIDTRGRVAFVAGFDDMPAKFPDDISEAAACLEIGDVRVPPMPVSQYGRIELAVDLLGAWSNPFDPDEVTLDASVVFPSGKRVCQPGFFMIDHRRETDEYTEMMVPEGHGEWCVRICALEPGPVECTLVARDKTGTARRNVEGISVADSDDPGFARQSKINGRYLQFDNGRTFFPIGHALEYPQDMARLVDRTLKRMAKHGENCNRWWMRSDELGLEWWDQVGWYRQSTAAQLDRLVEVGEDLGMYWIFTFDDHRDFWGERWAINPYSQTCGGPCHTVADWFMSPDAKKLQRRRIRYIVARWGYSPHVFCWELGNEFEGWHVGGDIVRGWHEEMADYLARIDPYERPITTSFSSTIGWDDLWSIDAIRLIQTHGYTNNRHNVAEHVLELAAKHRAYVKPHFLGEFGINGGSGKWTADNDLNGWAVHNALWASVVAGCCGTPMPWWYRDYVEARNLYPKFAAVSRFVEDIPFAAVEWSQVQVARGSMFFLNPTVLDPQWPNVLVAGLQSQQMAIVWIQNRNSTWYQHRHGHVPPVSACQIPLVDFPDGKYRIEWWETKTGEPTGRVEMVTATNNRLVLRLDALADDVAVKIFSQ